jgi:hypothetical protein
VSLAGVLAHACGSESNPDLPATVEALQTALAVQGNGFTNVVNAQATRIADLEATIRAGAAEPTPAADLVVSVVTTCTERDTGRLHAGSVCLGWTFNDAGEPQETLSGERRHEVTVRTFAGTTYVVTIPVEQYLVQGEPPCDLQPPPDFRGCRIEFRPEAPALGDEWPPP